MPYDVTIMDKVLNDVIDKENVEIRLWALDKENKPWLARINNFFTYCYLELPSIVNGYQYEWNISRASEIVKYVKKVLDENQPFNWDFHMKQKLYYYQGERKFPMIRLEFRTIEAVNHCKNFFNKPRNIYGFGNIFMNVLEANIDVIRKFFTNRDCNMCSWLRLKGEEIPFESDRRISTQGTLEKPMREIIVSYTQVFQETSKESESWFTFPRILAFDIETYTDNHKAMPNSLTANHVSNAISCIYYEVGKLDSRKKFVFVLGDSLPVESEAGGAPVKVVCVDSETKMIDAFADLIIELDPEIISGYNIFAYDYPYLDIRIKTKFRDWKQMGRIMNKSTEMSSMKWKSGAYGYNEINILEMDGRISVDMLPIIKRDYRLDKYSLDFVSKQFIGREKHDVQPVDMFLAYEHQTFVFEKVREFLMEHSEIANVSKLSNLILFDELKNCQISESKSDILELKTKLIKRYEMARNEWSKVIAYCVQDSDLVVDLFDKLNVWIGLNALSSVVGVTIVQLFTRGQQVRCLAQVYDKCYKKDVVLDKRFKDKVFYEGGFVFEPKPGLYDGVVCLDFASLYPSIMRAYNICFTTLVSPDLFDSIGDDKSVTIEVQQEEPENVAEALKRMGSYEDSPDFFMSEPRLSDAKNDDDSDDEDKPSGKVFRTYKYKWVNKATRYGILPEIQDHLVGSRNKIKKELAALEDEEETCTDPKRLAEVKILLVLKDKYSNALKVSANSLYGFLGAQNGGVLPLIEAAMCITCTGRRLIGQVNTFIETKYHGDVVYGDSVTYDTPVLVRRKHDLLNPIEDIDVISNSLNILDLNSSYSTYRVEWTTFNELMSSNVWDKSTKYKDGKEILYLNKHYMGLEVWSDKKWTPVTRIIRHKVNKTIYEIKTKSGLVRCTADHSLIRSNGTEVRPRDVKIGDELLHKHLPDLSNISLHNENIEEIDYNQLNRYVRQYIEHKKVDDNLLFSNINIKAKFLEEVSKYESFNMLYDYNTDSAKFYHIMNNFVEEFYDKNDNAKMNNIVDIYQYPYDSEYSNTYVYDLETENHHFAAGVGRMIVHNTDSSMVDLHIPDFKEAYAMGLRLADEISGTPEKKLPDGTIIPAQIGLFPPPLKIEFEKCLRILCIKKKKYAGLFIGRDGEFVREKNKDGTLGPLKILKRGIIVARRDTAKIVHKTYNKLLLMTLTKQPIFDSFNLIMSTLEDLVNDRLPIRENLSVIRALGANYKSAGYFMKVFGDELVRVGKPANPSDRLEYVIVKTKVEEDNEKEKVPLGLKMRLIDMYEDSMGLRTDDNTKDLNKENKSVDKSLILCNDDPLNHEKESVAIYPQEKIDYEYYIGHIIQASLDQLFSIGYMKTLEKFKDIGYTPQFCRMKSVSMIEPINMVVKMLDDYRKGGYKIEQTKTLITQVKEYYGSLLKEE